MTQRLVRSCLRAWDPASFRTEDHTLERTISRHSSPVTLSRWCSPCGGPAGLHMYPTGFQTCSKENAAIPPAHPAEVFTVASLPRLQSVSCGLLDPGACAVRLGPRPAPLSLFNNRDHLIHIVLQFNILSLGVSWKSFCTRPAPLRCCPGHIVFWRMDSPRSISSTWPAGHFVNHTDHLKKQIAHGYQV